MKIDGYEEITKEYWYRLPSTEVAVFRDENFANYYFKKVEKFPIVFEDRDRKIEIINKNRISIINTSNALSMEFVDSIPLLIEAVDKLKELRK